MVDAVLPNGLRVLVSRLETQGLVSVWCMYAVGSRNDPPGARGAGHFVEHMNFTRTTRLTRRRLQALIRRHAVVCNGYTCRDLTAYMQTAPSHALETLLFVEAERMTNCVYDPVDCEHERGVIAAEIERHGNRSEHILEQAVIARAFERHPYRHPIIGDVGDLMKVTRDDLYGHYRRHYVPAAATLVIVGDLDPDHAVSRAARAFDAVPPGASPSGALPPGDVARGVSTVHVPCRDGGRSLMLAFPAPAAADSDFYPFVVLDAILTGPNGLTLWSSARRRPASRHARLASALGESGRAWKVEGTWHVTEHPFAYTMAIQAHAGVDLDDIVHRVDEALERLMREPVAARELERAKTQLRAGLVFDAEDPVAVGHQIGYFASIGALHAHHDASTAVAAVSAADLQRVTSTYFACGRRIVGWMAS